MRAWQFSHNNLMQILYNGQPIGLTIEEGMMNNRKSPSKNPRVFYIVFAGILGLVVLGAVMTPLIAIAAFIGGAALSGSVCFAYYKLWLSKQIEYLSEENDELRDENRELLVGVFGLVTEGRRLYDYLPGSVPQAIVNRFYETVEYVASRHGTNAYRDH